MAVDMKLKIQSTPIELPIEVEFFGTDENAST